MVVFLAIVQTMGGCSKRRAHTLVPVSGKVTYQGNPLRFGIVMFQPEFGQPAVGMIQSDGTFRMVTRGEGEGAAVGTNAVRITCYEVQDPANSTKPLAGDRATRGEFSFGMSLIPKKYLSFDTSGIIVEVHRGRSDSVNLELQ